MLASRMHEVGLSQDNYGCMTAVNLWKERHMNYLRISLIVLVALLLGSATKLATSADASQNQSSAVERGYRTGYSDGYNAGTRDTVDSAARDYRNKEDYQRGDRSYNQAWGTLEDYRDGYQQGFEAGYAAGYDRRPFNSSIPTDLKIRGTADSGTPSSVDNTPSTVDNTSTVNNTPASNTTTPVANSLYIARDTMLLVELDSALSTDVSQRGDRFQARVIEPREFAGATVEGRITHLKRAGKVKGTAELQLSFETIHMPDGRSTGFNAVVVELMAAGNGDDVGTVDSEGGVKGKDSTKDDISKVGASAGIGAVIGAIFGGGKGAAIGAAVGGAASTGGVMTKRGKDLRLDRGQQMRIRASTESRIS